MKKIALKGFAALIVLLIVCFFFSGTIKTLTTPKVMITQPKQGRLKEQITLTGYLTFSNTKEVTLPKLPDGASLTITRVYAVPGLYVHEGDVLFETRFTGVEALIAAQDQLYTEALAELLELEKQNNTLRIHRGDERWLTAYDALVAAYETRHAALIALEVEAHLQGVELAEGRLPDGMTDETLLRLQSDYDLADQDVRTTLSAMNQADRVGIGDEAYSYVMRKRSIEDRMVQATQQIIQLRSLELSARQIHADQSGYVTDVQIAPGQAWDGRTAALTMSTSDASLLLRADTSNATRSIEAGAAVTISGRYGSTVETAVMDTGYDSYGNRYADITLEQRDMTSLDTSANLMNKGITLRIDYTAASSTCLLPASAVRGSGDARYVYATAEKENAFGQITLFVEQQSVTVLDESGDTVSVTGIPDNKGIVYMEDRAIGPGSEVMTYE